MNANMTMISNAHKNIDWCVHVHLWMYTPIHIGGSSNRHLLMQIYVIPVSEHLSIWPSDNPTMWPSGIQIWPCDCLAMCACHHIMTWSCATCDQQITWSSDHLAIWPSDHQTIQSFEHLSIYASEHLSTYAGEHLAIWPSHHMTVWESAYPTIRPPHGLTVAGPCQNAHVHIHWCAHVHNEFYTLIHIHWMSNRQPLICIHVLFHPRSCTEAASRPYCALQCNAVLPCTYSSFPLKDWQLDSNLQGVHFLNLDVMYICITKGHLVTTWLGGLGCFSLRYMKSLQRVWDSCGTLGLVGEPIGFLACLVTVVYVDPKRQGTILALHYLLRNSTTVWAISPMFFL